MINLKPFIQQGQIDLKSYIADVDCFRESLGQPDGLEKTPLRDKPPETYARNMLAVGVLSRIMRDEFIRTQRKIIVLPDCLKNINEEACCKADLGNAYACTMCNSECIVFESMERFSNDHTMIILEPEDMNTFFADIRKHHGTVGVVGVACALTMMSGFEKTIRYKLPTQGVFLNYSSCTHHWANPAYNTCYSLRRMFRVLNNRDGSLREDTENRGETYSMEKHGLSPDDFYFRLDKLSDIFMADYLPHFKNLYPDIDIYDLCTEIRKILLPDLITRDSA